MPVAHAKLTSPLLSAALAAALAAGATACHRDSGDSAPQLRPVRYQVVATTGGVFERSFDGVTSAGSESNLSFRVGGTLRGIEVAVGDRVEKNQAIALLDRTDYELQVQQARASLASANAQSRNARANYTRVKSLFESQNASPSDLDAARAAYRSAQANASAVAKQVELARQRLSYTRLVAPVAGAIAQVHVDENENVAPGQPIVLLTSGDQPKITVSVADKYIGEVDARDSVRIEFHDLPGASFEGVVTEVSPTSAGSGARVSAQLVEPNDAVRPGMTAKVTFAFGSAAEPARIILPGSAVGEDRQGRFVYTVEPGASGTGVVHRTPVEIDDELHPQGVPIERGLKAGDLVVIAGRTRIHDGLQVRVPPAPPETAAP